MNILKDNQPSSDKDALRSDVIRIRTIGTYVVGGVLLCLVLALLWFGGTTSTIAYVVSGAIGVIGLLTAILSLVYTEKKQEQLRLLSNVLDERLSMYSKDELLAELKSYVDLTDRIRHLIEDKKFVEAEQLAHEQIKADPDNLRALDTYVSTLLAFNSKEKCEEAWRFLQQTKKDVHNLTIYTRLAFLFWEFGDVERAIVVAENGLQKAQKAANQDYVNRFMNSLAYYYTDSGKADYENSARSYSEQIYKADSHKPKWLDTFGYVKIGYGRTEKEILEGLELCLQAYRADKEHLKNAYEKHAKRAVERLAVL